MCSATVPTLCILSDASLRHPALVGYRLARHRPVCRRGIRREVRYEVNGCAFSPSGSATMPEGGAALRTVQRRLLAQTYHHHRQPFRYGNRLRRIMDFLAYLSLKHPERLRIDAAVRTRSSTCPKLSRFPASGDLRLL